MNTDTALPLHRHPQPHKELARRHRTYWAHKGFRISVFFSTLLFIASIFISFFAIQYATESASSSVTDIILSNFPVVNVDGLFIYGTLLLIIFASLLVLAHPKRIPFTLHSMTIFYLIRSGFVSLTHIGPFPVQTENAYDLGVVLSRFLFSSDLFFSAHTGAPFLLALMFWREKTVRYIFLAWSIFMGTVVLLGHLHYTIDVVSAFFITYAIYCIAVWLFPKDRALFLADAPIPDAK
ncbi:MAG: phosphatase PAP2-related protein [bacterium]|nr:phosphatase PAP2-related protein [bacterium]